MIIDMEILTLDNSFKYNLFDKLWKEYQSAKSRKETTIYKFIEDDQNKALTRLLGNLKAREITADPQNIPTAVEKAPISIQLLFYNYIYENATVTKKNSAEQIAFSYFYHIIRLASKDPEPRPFFVNSQNNFDSFFNAFLPFFTMEIEKIPTFHEDSITSKVSLRNHLKIYFEWLSSLEGKNKETFMNLLYEEEMEYNTITELFLKLQNNAICFFVGEYLYDNGFCIDENNTLVPREKKKNSSAKKGRPEKVDKTMTLLELCMSNSLLQTSSSGTVNEKEQRKLCYLFFESLYEQVCTLDKKTKKEYENIFIPLIINQFSGTTFCLIGKNHYRLFYENLQNESLREKFMEDDFPFSLSVLNFSDVSNLPRTAREISDYLQKKLGPSLEEEIEQIIQEKLGQKTTSSIVYETASHFSGYKIKKQGCKNYFDFSYDLYCKSVNDAKAILYDINRMTILPKNLGTFEQYFIAMDSSMEASRLDYNIREKNYVPSKEDGPSKNE